AGDVGDLTYRSRVAVEHRSGRIHLWQGLMWRRWPEALPYLVGARASDEVEVRRRLTQPSAAGRDDVVEPVKCRGVDGVEIHRVPVRELLVVAESDRDRRPQQRRGHGGPEELPGNVVVVEQRQRLAPVQQRPERAQLVGVVARSNE